MAHINLMTKHCVRLDDNDTFEHKGKLYRIEVVHDEGHEEPWNDGDGWGIVSDWRRQDWRGRYPKEPGERILCTNGRAARVFDWAGTMRKAKEEGWDAKPYGEGTKGQRAARAVQAEFDRFAAWCNDQWHYVGVMVTHLVCIDEENEEYEEGKKASLWGLESDDYEHLQELAKELAEEVTA